MKRPILNKIVLITVLFVTYNLNSQSLFWADKEVISEGISFFSSFESSDNYIYSAWQEVNYFPDNTGGLSNLVIKRSSDGYTWEEISHNIESVEFYGQSPVQNYSIDTDSNGNLILAYAKGDISAFNKIEIYTLKSGSIVLKKIDTINYQKAVLSPTINFRGENGELGYILFFTQLKNISKEIQEDSSELILESGALSIFYSTSSNGQNWSESQEFINTDSDQSYLPIYNYYKGEEIVIYQSVITSDKQNNNFQLYIKTKSSESGNWSDDRLITGAEEYITGVGNEMYTEFDNQRPSFIIRDGELGLTWERSYGYDSSKIYYATFGKQSGEFELFNSEKITTGSRSCSRPRGFEFNNEFYLLWFDNQLGSNDIVMATPDKLSGIWIEKIVSDDRNYFSVFGDFVNFKNTLRIFWEDQSINRESFNSSRGRIQALNPDNNVDSPKIISSYKDRDNKNVIRLSWTKPEDSSGIKGFYYTWFKKDDGKNIITEKRVLSNIQQSEYLYATEDGEYIFTVFAEDNAGNISKTRDYLYTFDQTPPNRVKFPELRTDEKGFLRSNTESIIWDSWDEDAVGFSHTLTSLGINYDPNDFDINRVKRSNNFNSIKSYNFNNIDNGYYALTVRVIDEAGNIGNPEAVLFKLNKYNPITYISYINYSQNDIGRLVTTIHGRGFRAGGDVTTVMLDRDGKEPYDYSFNSSSGVFDIVSDRKIEGPNLADIEGGTYRVGIIHPIRGTFFSGPTVNVDSTGTIKFGDFTQGYEEVWQKITTKRFNITIEIIVFILISIVALIILIFTFFRLVSIRRESRILNHDAKALSKGTPFLSEKEILRIRDMEKHGFGLRAKFTIAIITLIIGVIALISLPLASFMIDTQKKNLTDSLVSRTEILLNSISTGAKDYIELKDELALDNLIKTSEAMDEVIWATIVGVSRSDSKVTNAIWAYTDQSTIGYFIPLPSTVTIEDYKEYFITEKNRELFLQGYSIDEDIYKLNNKLDLEIDFSIRRALTDSGFPRDVVLGETKLSDPIDPVVDELIKNIEQKGSEELISKKEELIKLQADRRNTTDSTILSEIQDNLFSRAKAFRDANTKDIDSLKDFEDYFNNSSKEKSGFARCHWNESAIGNEILSKFKVTPRCIPINSEKEKGKCIFTGKESNQRILFARSY